MDFGFSSNAFRQHDLETAIDAIADAGYDGIEILLDEPHLYPGDPDGVDAETDAIDVGTDADAPDVDAQTATDADVDREVERILAQLDDRGLAISNCNAFMLSAMERSAESAAATYDRETEPFHHPSFVEPDPEDRQRRIDHTKRALETADALGAEHISITPGGPVPNETTREDALELFVEGLREVLPTAESVGVDVLVEPEPELLIESSEQFLDLVDRIDSPRLGCNFDAGHFFCVDEDPAELVETLGPHSPHYHLEDIPADRTHEHTQLGEGGLDVDGFLQAIEDSGYDGYVTVELYPYGETAAETARDAMAYLEAHGWA